MLNSIEPPWYVTRMPGGVTGKAREGLPMSINGKLSRSVAQLPGHRRGLSVGFSDLLALSFFPNL